ncbi:hypothetical protein EI94DRAFT_1748000, partial [Lactarius quietus]
MLRRPLHKRSRGTDIGRRCQRRCRESSWQSTCTLAAQSDHRGLDGPRRPFNLATCASTASRTTRAITALGPARTQCAFTVPCPYLLRYRWLRAVPGTDTQQEVLKEGSPTLRTGVPTVVYGREGIEGCALILALRSLYELSVCVYAIASSCIIAADRSVRQR